MTSPRHKGSALCSRAEGGQAGVEDVVGPKAWMALSNAFGGHFPGKAKPPRGMEERLLDHPSLRRLGDMVRNHSEDVARRAHFTFRIR